MFAIWSSKYNKQEGTTTYTSKTIASNKAKRMNNTFNTREFYAKPV